MTTTLTLASGAHHEAQDHAEKNTKVVKNRVQFDLPPRSMERPNALKPKNEPSSYAEVVRMPCLYEELVEETDNGKTFLIRDENDSISPYRMFL
jgi:hypothetical protein